MAENMAADAASMIGEAALNGVFKGLSQALGPLILKNLGHFFGLDKKLTKLERALLHVQPLLNDAETRLFTDESVRSWVAELRLLTYDMEDILDEMNYELLRSEQENGDKSDGQQVPSFFSCLELHKGFGAFKNCFFKLQIGSKIDEVLEKLDEIHKKGNHLKLIKGDGGRTREYILKRRETASIEDENRVFGRESDKKEIISLLKTDESSGSSNLSVIGIVGMGGLGKTTLARLAYNDTDQFDMKVWVHVSLDFDRVRVIKCIIEDITKEKPKLGSLNPMQYRLQELVKEKKLLLVLDDAWTENPEDWETLLAPLSIFVQKGSKIIVTTRSEAVCKSMGSRDCIYTLKPLSDDDCWIILKKKVLGYSDNTLEQVILEKLRVKIVKMCQGLPLVANVVGGLLRMESVDKWERLLKSEIWLSKTKDDILPALMLSYLCLDPHIKRCFTYTATYFHQSYFKKDQTIHLWMAEGFIEDNKSDEMKDIANDYFDNLVARCFFQPFFGNNYGMHDLICELAEVIMGNVSILIKREIGSKKLTEETRHVSIYQAKSLILDKLVIAKSLRTLSIHYLNCKKVWKQITHDLKSLRVLNLYRCWIHEMPESIGNMKHLRYLALDDNYIESLPDSICTLYNLQTLSLSGSRNLLELPSGIGSLINLRYLFLRGTRLQMFPDSLCKLEKLQWIDISFCKEVVVLPTNICKLNDLRRLNLSATSVEKLPDSICRLYNLQSLCLFNCKKLTELPKEMSNLINLKSFDMNGELIKTSLLPSIERFTNIRKLSNYCITNEIGIGRLNLLINLHEIRITNLEKVENMEEARAANLKNKHQLVKLVMEWSEPNFSSLLDGNVETEILEALEPPRDGNVETKILEALEPSHVSLRHLTVKNYGGFKFPGWLGDPSFSKLVEMELIGCKKCKLLTSLGQLRSLKNLVIADMQELKHVGREFFGNRAFPSLLKLQLRDLPKLEGWSEAKKGDFPRLIELEVKNCPKLRELPVTPFTLKTLRIEKIQKFENLSGQNSEIGHCNEITMLKSLSNLTSLSSLTICGFRRVELLPKRFLQSLKNIKEFRIENCDKLLNLSEAPLTTLSRLYVMDCPNMTSFGKDFQNSTCLKHLSIIGCPRLESSPEELTIVSCLRYFMVAGCSNTILTSLLPHLSTLEHLLIKKINGLQYLLPDLLLNLTSLKYLEIEDCIVFTSLLAMLPSSLVKLTIIRCTELASIPDQLPSSLEKLKIEECTELASLPDELPSSLKFLTIENCTALASLPDELPSSLALFSIDDCDKIKSLPRCPCNLTTLWISNCPLVESFPENGLPTGLATLRIVGCPILTKQCRDRESKEWNMIKCIEHVDLTLN